MEARHFCSVVRLTTKHAEDLDAEPAASANADGTGGGRSPKTSEGRSVCRASVADEMSLVAQPRSTRLLRLSRPIVGVDTNPFPGITVQKEAL
ncbi:hypothetical protein HPB50_021394 [Hyalomma asiaticum]|uniref:Uncharacterized protein n=1 Tax=Hyalomma asiaticum TaxID=266040 RepID=A0ACB7RRD5_HYAAI|nr:hypothetical protein HPB50_021394 [Hyalomma asiaticum]